jgi:hypothetical protein
MDFDHSMPTTETSVDDGTQQLGRAVSIGCLQLGQHRPETYTLLESTKMILNNDNERDQRKDDIYNRPETHLEPDTTDGLGNERVFDSVKVPVCGLPAEDLGAISETLHTHLQVGIPVKVTGMSPQWDKPIEVEIEQSGKFINAFRLAHGFRTGTKTCIAVRGDDFRFRYAKTFLNILEDPNTAADSWYVKAHLYYRA